MILYHGGFTTVSESKILKPTRAMDFGQGFYATSSFKQAKDWSLIKKDRFGYDMAVVSEFEFDEQDLSSSSLNSKVFERADDEWLDFVIANRQDANFKYEYDIVKGAVANDSVYASINLYEQGFLSRPQLLEELRAWKFVNQFCFHTERSLAFLNFVKSEEVR